MKNIRFLLLAAFCLSMISSYGQIADGISYQAVALDEKGKEIAGHDINGLIIHSKEIAVRFSILNNTEDGTVLYSEVHKTYTDQYGQFSLVIGHGEVSSEGTYQSLLDINWGAEKLFLKVEIDIRSRGEFKLMSIQQMMAVPFAFHAFNASKAIIKYDDILEKPTFATVATSGDYNDLLNLPLLFSGNYDDLTNKPALFDGNYRSLINLPVIPTKTTELINDAGYLTTFSEKDPAWTTASANYYTKSNMHTSGASQVHFSNLTNKPTTLTGYGITDAMNTSHVANGITNANISFWNNAFSWGNHAGLYRPIDYVPTWNEITSNPFSFTSATNNQLIKYNSTSRRWENWTPNFLTGYTETDPAWTIASANYYTKSNLQTNGASQVHFNNLTNKPTTLAGYGITNAMNTTHVANGITNTNITNWNTAFGWGNHAGLYRPIAYVPAWNEITSNPFVFTSAANNQLIKYNSTSGRWENWTPNFLTTYTETDPAWTIASANYYTKSNLQTSGTSQMHFSNLTNKPTTLAGYGITDAMNSTHVANGITSIKISNWDSAFIWGNHAIAGYQPFIAAGTTAQYWRGDKTWQTLNNAAVGLGNVENIQLSTWPGSTNINTLGTITAGTWNAGSVTSNGAVTAATIVKTGGTALQFLKADGSIDEKVYLTEIREAADEFTATAAQTSYTLSQTPSATSKVKMYINGIRISNTAYSVAGATLTYNPANNGSYVLVEGDRIQFDYSY